MDKESLIKMLHQNENDYHELPMYGLMSDWYLRYWHLHIALYQYLELDKEDYFGPWAIKTMKRDSVNILRLLSELEGCYQLTKYMAFDEDNAILDEMRKRYYKLYFKTSKEEKTSPPCFSGRAGLL